MSDIDPSKLLQSEYPDTMAEESCTCEIGRTCGAHRLLERYNALYDHLRNLNRERRELRAKLVGMLSMDDIELLRSTLAFMVSVIRAGDPYSAEVRQAAVRAHICLDQLTEDLEA